MSFIPSVMSMTKRKASGRPWAAMIDSALCSAVPVNVWKLFGSCNPQHVLHFMWMVGSRCGISYIQIFKNCVGKILICFLLDSNLNIEIVEQIPLAVNAVVVLKQMDLTLTKACN